MTAEGVITGHLTAECLKSFTQQEIDDDSVYSLMHDYIEDIRCGTNNTGLPCDWSRHYESRSAAAKFGDHWIGWTYWYGGGKHGEPGEIDWITDAYFLDAVEVMEPVMKFTKRE